MGGDEPEAAVLCPFQRTDMCRAQPRLPRRPSKGQDTSDLGEVNLSQIRFSPSPAGVGDSAQDVLALGGPTGNNTDMLSEGQGSIQGHSQQSRVWLIADSPPIDADVGAPILVP